jgi:hypothetical protein
MTVAPPKPNPIAAVRESRGQLVSGMAVAPPKPNPTVAALREVHGQRMSGMTVAPPKPNPMAAAVRELRGQLASGMAIAPPARGHALLPPSDRWPEVCARSAGASALFVKLATTCGFTRDYGEEMLQIHIEGEPLNGTGVAARPKRLRLGVMDQLGRFSFRMPSGSATKRLWVRAPGTLWTEIPVGTHSFSTSVNMVYGDINADNMITNPQQSGSDRFLFDLAVGAKVQMPLPTGTDKSPYYYSEVADLNRDNSVNDVDNLVRISSTLYDAGTSGANLL